MVTSSELGVRPALLGVDGSDACPKNKETQNVALAKAYRV